MARIKTPLTILAASIALVGLMMGSAAIPLFVVALVALVGLQFAGKDRPMARRDLSTARPWYMWLAGSAAAFLVGLVAVASDGDGELSSLVWTTWMLSWAAAIVLGVVGLGLGATRLVGNRP